MTTEQPTRGVIVNKTTRMGFVAESRQIIWHRINHATGNVFGEYGFFKDSTIEPLAENALEIHEFSFFRGDFSQETLLEQVQAINALDARISTLPEAN